MIVPAEALPFDRAGSARVGPSDGQRRDASRGMAVGARPSPGGGPTPGGAGAGERVGRGPAPQCFRFQRTIQRCRYFSWSTRPRIGPLGHRRTCGSAPGRGTWGRPPYLPWRGPGDHFEAVCVGAGPTREGCQALTRAREPIGLVSRRSGGRRLRRRASRKHLLGGRRPLLRALLEGFPGTGGGGGEEEGHEGDSPDEEGNEDDQQQG